MKNEGRKSIVTLVIWTILVMIVAVVMINYAQQMIEETKVQDLRTDMLLMQAESKKGLEEVCFRTVNMNASKKEDLAKINEIKKEFLDGVILSEAPAEVQEAAQSVPNMMFDDSCYYLNQDILKEMGITEVDETQLGYFIVKYDFSNAGVEIINTKGIYGNYTLTQIVQAIEGGQS